MILDYLLINIKALENKIKRLSDEKEDLIRNINLTKSFLKLKRKKLKECLKND
jgi:hypothetical protein